MQFNSIGFSMFKKLFDLFYHPFFFLFFALFILHPSSFILLSTVPPELCVTKDEAIETSHEITINGKKIAYKAVAGTLILKDEKCNPKASVFYISYIKEGVDNTANRPISFCFNGGPGSSSVWLHLGMLGPKRVDLSVSGDTLPPYKMVDNDFSMLEMTDLVFIDPVSTGYSQAIPFEDEKKYHGVEEDIKFFAEFIRLFVTRVNRWESPKFIVGASYGTTRAAALANYMHDKDYLYINGIILISSILNFESIDFSAGNDLPYLLYLPSYTAAAWYHKKLAPELQENFDKTIELSRQFVSNDYVKALFKGDLLSQVEKQEVIKKFAYFTGIDPNFIEKSNLRIEMSRFDKELLRSNKRTIGRFDSRYLGIDADAAGEHTEYDPSISAIFGAFAAAFNEYVHTDLKWSMNQRYTLLASLGNTWDYGITNQYLNVSENLRKVMTKNPFLTVFVANGYYDLATPFFATEYTFNHLGLDPSLLNHVTMKYYHAGHMMYTDPNSLKKLKQDLAKYFTDTLKAQKKEAKDPK